MHDILPKHSRTKAINQDDTHYILLTVWCFSAKNHRPRRPGWGMSRAGEPFFGHCRSIRTDWLKILHFDLLLRSSHPDVIACVLHSLAQQKSSVI